MCNRKMRKTIKKPPEGGDIGQLELKRLRPGEAHSKKSKTIFGHEIRRVGSSLGVTVFAHGKMITGESFNLLNFEEIDDVTQHIVMPLVKIRGHIETVRETSASRILVNTESKIGFSIGCSLFWTFRYVPSTKFDSAKDIEDSPFWGSPPFPFGSILSRPRISRST